MIQLIAGEQFVNITALFAVAINVPLSTMDE